MPLSAISMRVLLRVHTRHTIATHLSLSRAHARYTLADELQLRVRCDFFHAAFPQTAFRAANDDALLDASIITFGKLRNLFAATSTNCTLKIWYFTWKTNCKLNIFITFLLHRYEEIFTFVLEFKKIKIENA